MSPPTKVPDAPDVDRQAELPTAAPAGSQRTAALAPPQAVVLGGQHTAGNRAIAGAIGASRGIQRAPNDEDPRTSGLAHGPTLDSAGGVATAQTLPGTQGRGDPRRSGLAHGPTLNSAGGVATAGTLPGTDRGDPRRSGMAYGPTLDSSGGAGTGPTLPGGGTGGAPGAGPAPAPGPAGGGPPGSGGPTGPDDDDAQLSESGALPQRVVGNRGPTGPVGYTDNGIASAYQRNPALVHRAINWTWYRYILDQQRETGTPRGIKVGNAVVVAPDYDGPGPPPRTTPIEEPDPDGVLGPNDPIPGDPRLAQGPRQQKPDLSDPNAKRAIFPGSRRGPEPGMKPAVPLTHDEVVRAYRQNPASVHQSDTDDWHDQVFAIDRGQGQPPRAYRSGGTIIVDPSYPLDGRPPDASPRGSVKQPGPGWDLGTVLNPVKIPTDPKEKARMLRDPVEGPRLKQAIDAQNDRERATHIGDAKRATAAIADAKKPAAPAPAAPAPAPDPTKAAQTISPTGYVPQEKKPAKWDVKNGELSRETSDEQKRVTDTGTDTKIKSSKKSYSLAKGAGHESKQRDESQTGDTFKANEKSTKVNASLAGLALNRGSATETGSTAEGPKTKTERNVGATIGPDGVGGNASTAITSQSGMKAEAKGDIKVGPDGVELSGTGSITSPKGFTGHLSVSGKNHVLAGDPKQLPNGKFAVQFTNTDENGVELGGGWSKPGGGASVAVNVGSSTSNSQYETRVFDTKAEATMFQMTAAMTVASEVSSIAKATTADGALAMKEGEVRGTTQTDTDTVGGSAGMSQVSVGVTSTDSTTTGLKIEKMSGNRVRVTPSVAEQEALNASISVAGGFGNTKGGSETNSFAVTYEFDLGTEAGKKAFERYTNKQRLPPPMPPDAKWIDSTTGHAIEDHDVYSFAHIGKIGWGDHATQETVTDEAGTHTTAIGGQSETVDLNRIRYLTGDKNRHATADIVGKMDNDKITAITALMTVGGEDADFNREQFRKIFSDKGPKPGTTVKTSGDWTLSADIDKKQFERMARDNDAMSKAKTREQQLKIYSELAQKNGARMLSGQVRGGGRKLAWNLELKGDPNFPGASGRQALNQQRAKLAAQLQAKPASAGSVAAEAKDTLDALKKRLDAVSDESRYTDLPTELRDEQKDLINTHISEFKSLRSQAVSIQMGTGRKENLTVVLNRAAEKDGYRDVPEKDRGWRKAQDLVNVHQTEITALEKEIVGSRTIVEKMFNRDGSVRFGSNYMNRDVWKEHNSNAKQSLSMFKLLGPRLTAAVEKTRDLKDKWSGEPDPKVREDQLRAYDRLLLDIIRIMDSQLEALRSTAREAYLIVPDSIVEDEANDKFFTLIKVDNVTRSNISAGLDDTGSMID